MNMAYRHINVLSVRDVLLLSVCIIVGSSECIFYCSVALHVSEACYELLTQ